MTASSTRLERAVIVVSQAARPGKTLDIARAKNARIRGAQTNAYSARDVDRPVVIFLKRISRIKLSYDISVKLHATYFYLTREMYTHRCVKTSEEYLFYNIIIFLPAMSNQCVVTFVPAILSAIFVVVIIIPPQSIFIVVKIEAAENRGCRSN